MKTKQTYMVALFGKECSNAENMGDSKELTSHYKLIDKKTERTVVDCRVYMGKSRNASTVYAAIWVSGVKTENRPDGWVYGETSGKGQAGGYGYHKSSAAVAGAIRSAGITLMGSPYGHPVNGDTPAQTRKLLKQPAHIGGCGSGSVECALLAIAYAAGYTDCIVSR
jgi:hypothetical protein